MTDERMDARLRSAGERWRATNTAFVDIDPDATTEAVEHTARLSHRGRYGLLASAAVVAAVLVTGGALLLPNGSGPTPSGNTVPLEGHVWLVNDGHGDNSTASLYIDSDGNLVADDECVLIGGKTTTNGDTLTVTDEIVRYKSCTDQYGPGFYQDGVALLDGSSSYTITSDGLTISRGDKHIAFSLAPESTPVPTLDFPTLTDTGWLLVSGKDTHGKDIPIAGDRVAGYPALRIGDRGAVTGSDGCHHFRFPATVQFASTITIRAGKGAIYSSFGCAAAPNATELALLPVLSGRLRATVVGGELTLTRGSAELVYRWNPTSAATDVKQLHGVTWHLVDAAGTAMPTNTTVDFSDGNWELNNGTLRPGSRTSGALAELLSSSVNPWFVHDGRLYVLFNDAQAGALVFVSGASLEQPPPLGVQPWHLVEITGGSGRYRNGAPPAEQSTLDFTNIKKGFSVTHTCYTYVGTATRHGQHTTIGNTSVTHAHPCPSAAGRDTTAALVDSILHGTVTIKTASSSVTITHPGVGTLAYSSSPPLADVPLTGTHWQLETVDDNGTDRVATNQSLRITNGRLLAEDGTDAIDADVHIDDGTITLSDVAVGGAGGTSDDPVRDTVDRVLHGTVQYEVLTNHLTITSGNSQLIYRAAQS